MGWRSSFTYLSFHRGWSGLCLPEPVMRLDGIVGGHDPALLELDKGHPMVETWEVKGLD